MLDVRTNRDLQAALLGIKRAEREVRLEINREARNRMRPEWIEALRGHIDSRLDDRVIVKGARVAVGARQVSFKAATSNRPLRGGLVPSTQWAPVEFGARRRQKTITTTSRRGNRYQVTKLIGAQFPTRQKHGRVAHPAAGLVGRVLVGLWLRTIVEQFRSFAEIKER